jgi:hypothetical protein
VVLVSSLFGIKLQPASTKVKTVMMPKDSLLSFIYLFGQQEGLV